MLDALLQMIRLKDQTRTGWTLRGVELPESVADHSWATALLCIAYADEAGVDRSRCVEMAIVHDLAEAITGDVPTRVATMDDATRALEKQARERRAMDLMLNAWQKPPAERISALWHEYERRETAESLFVRDMNLIDMCAQAFVYEQAERNDPGPADDRSGFEGLDEFFATTAPRLSTETGRRLFDQLRRRYGALPRVRARRG